MRDNWLTFWSKQSRSSSGPGAATGRAEISERQFQLIAEDIKRKLGADSEDIILDVGCGNGFITSNIANICSFVIGTDFCGELLKTAVDKYKLANMEYIQCEASKLPFRDNSFDGAVCYSVLLYLSWTSVSEVIKELRRVCKVDAVIVLGDIPDRSRKGKYRSRFKELLVEINRYVRRFMGLSWHPQFAWFSKDELLEFIHGLGLSGEIESQHDGLPYSHYRFDLIIRNTKGDGP